MTPTESTEGKPMSHYRNAADDAFEANPTPLMKAAPIDMSPGAFMEVESTEPAGRSEEEALVEILSSADPNPKWAPEQARAVLAAGYRSPAQVREAQREATQRGIRIAADLVRDHVIGATGKGIGAFLDERAARADSLSTDGGAS